CSWSADRTLARAEPRTPCCRTQPGDPEARNPPRTKAGGSVRVKSKQPLVSGATNEIREFVDATFASSRCNGPRARGSIGGCTRTACPRRAAAQLGIRGLYERWWHRARNGGRGQQGRGGILRLQDGPERLPGPCVLPGDSDQRLWHAVPC